MDPTIKRLSELEDDIRYRDLADGSEPEFRYIRGSLPVLVSAPHAAAHTRSGKCKEEDAYTGALAQLLGQETGAHVLYARRKSLTDPNVDPNAPYKHRLAQVVRDARISFVIDLHGSKESSKCGIEIGTANGKSCLPLEKDLIVRTFEEHGFIKGMCDSLMGLWVDQLFSGEGTPSEERVIGFVRQKLGISAVQIEMNAYLRIPERRLADGQSSQPFSGHPELIVIAAGALAAVIWRIANHLNNDGLGIKVGEGLF